MNNWMERLAKEIASAAIETAQNDGEAPALEFARQDIEERFVDGDITRQEKDDLMRLTREHLSSANFGRGGRPKSAHNRDHKYLSAEEHEQAYARARKRIQRYKTERKGKFEDGGVVYRHKWIPTMTFRPTAETKRGWRGIQHDPKSLSRLERNKGKQVSYSLAEMKELWTKEGTGTTANRSPKFKVGGVIRSGINWPRLFGLMKYEAGNNPSGAINDLSSVGYESFIAFFSTQVGYLLATESNLEIVTDTRNSRGSINPDKEIYVSMAGFKRGKEHLKGFSIRIPLSALEGQYRSLKVSLLNWFISDAALFIPQAKGYSIVYLNSKLSQTNRPMRNGFLDIGFPFFSDKEFQNYLLPLILSEKEYHFGDYVDAKQILRGNDPKKNSRLSVGDGMSVFEWKTPSHYAASKRTKKLFETTKLFEKGGVVDFGYVDVENGASVLSPSALDIFAVFFLQHNPTLAQKNELVVVGGAGDIVSASQMGLPRIVIENFALNEDSKDDAILNHLGVTELSGVTIRIPKEAVAELSRKVGARPAAVDEFQAWVHQVMQTFSAFVGYAAVFYDDDKVGDTPQGADGIEIIFILPPAQELAELDVSSDMYDDADINPLWVVRPQILANMGLATTPNQSTYDPNEALHLLAAQFPFRPSGSDITMFRKGGKVEVEIIEADKNFDEYVYRGVLGDFDGDGTANADDVNPTNPRQSGMIEKNTPFAETLGSVLDLKRAMDDKMYNYVDKLKALTPENGKIIARTKTPYSILKKLVMKRLTDKRRGLTDLIGGTILADNRRQLEAIMDKVRNGALGEVVEIEDMYAKPKNGYRAYHLLVDFEGTIVELQLKTKRQKAINELTHEPYKAGKLNAPLMLEMTSVAAAADEGDAEAQMEFARFMRQPNLDKVFWVN